MNLIRLKTRENFVRVINCEHIEQIKYVASPGHLTLEFVSGEVATFAQEDAFKLYETIMHICDVQDTVMVREKK